MADEAKVTVVFMIPQKGGSYKPQEFRNVIVNARAPAKKLASALLQSFPEVDFGDEEADLLVQAPDGSPLSNVAIQDGSRLVVFPKYGAEPLVKRENE